MNYHEILLVPCTGHFGRGQFDPGPNYGKFFEMDVTKELLLTIGEELDNDRVRCRTLDLWNGPGMTRTQCAAQAVENTLSLHVSFGRGQAKDDPKNTTRSWFSDPGATWLAKLLSESVADWARCSNFHHEMSHPKHRAGFFPHHAVLIEPFSLATPDPEIYLSRLRQLGKAMAGTIVDFFTRSNQALRSKPMGAWSNEKKKDDDRTLVSSFLHAVDNGHMETFLTEESADNDGNNAAGNKSESEKFQQHTNPPKSGGSGRPLAPNKPTHRP